MMLGLLSVELPSSVDKELFLATIVLFTVLEKSFSWLIALNKEDLGGDLVRSGELKGEDSVEDAVSLSRVPCLCRLKFLGDSLEVSEFKLNEEEETRE